MLAVGPASALGLCGHPSHDRVANCHHQDGNARPFEGRRAGPALCTLRRAASSWGWLRCLVGEQATAYTTRCSIWRHLPLHAAHQTLP